MYRSVWFFRLDVCAFLSQLVFGSLSRAELLRALLLGAGRLQGLCRRLLSVPLP